jgi:hypothetical protein
MDDIWNIENTDFSSIKLYTPKPLQGGTFFAPIKGNNKYVLIQTPKCLTKNGIHKTGKKTYTDLKIGYEHKNLIKWIEGLERHVRNIIYEKRDIWFHDEPSLDEIDYLWNSCVRPSKQSYLIRSFIQRFKNLEQVQVWNENNQEISIDDIGDDDNLISILEIGGLKFTSQSFQLEIYLRQVVVIKDKPIFSKCLIKLDNNQSMNNSTQQDDTPQDDTQQDDTQQDDTPQDDTQQDDTQQDDTPQDDTQQDDTPQDDTPRDDTPQYDTQQDDTPQDDTPQYDTPQDDVIHEVEPETLESNMESQKTENKQKKVSINTNDLTIEETNIKEEHLEKNGGIKKEISSEIQNSKLNSIAKSLTLEKNENSLEEFELKVSDNDSPIKLKTPKDVYLEIYKKARQKALDAKKEAIKAFLEAKKIKETYLLDEWGLDSSDEEGFFNNEIDMED